MLYLAMMFWVGLTLNAPTWYWWVWGVSLFIKIIQYGYSMYKQGRDNK